MKKSLFLLLSVIITMTSTAKTVNLTEAGTLSSYIDDNEKYQIEELTITGPLNGTDFLLIRDMAGNDNGYESDGKLQILDLSDATFVTGGDNYDATGHGTVNNQVGEEQFYVCISLTKLILPKNVTAIKSKAFYGCSSLKKVVMPDGITSIAADAFNNCRRLEKRIYPSIHL